MKFYNITQKVYDWYKENIDNPLNAIRDVFREQIFVTNGKFDEGTEDELQGSYRLYQGEHLIGDAYVPQSPLSSTITKDFGQIKKGSTLADVIKHTQGSMSAVMDMVLCPNYASVYHAPYFVAVSKVESPYCYVNDLVPQANISSVSTAQAINTNTKYSCNAGPVMIHKTPIVGTNIIRLLNKGSNTNDDFTADDEYQFIRPGQVTLEYSISCEQGPKEVLGKDNTLKDSKGNNTQYCSLEEDILMPEEGEQPSQKLTTDYSISLPTGEYVLTARTGINPVQYTYYAAYPIYQVSGKQFINPITQKTSWVVDYIIKCSAEDSYKALLNSTDMSIITLPVQKKAIILVPYGYHLSEIYMEAHNDTFSTYNMIHSMIKMDEVTVDPESGDIIHTDTPNETDYNLYMFDNKCIGDGAQYQIKITKD